MPETRLFPLEGGLRTHPEVERWFERDDSELRRTARHWFAVIRQAGADVLDLLHDDHPTACVGTLAFAEVNVYRRHVNVGFFLGTSLGDPAGLLTGTGRYMRHVRIEPGVALDEPALRRLILDACADMRARQAAPHPLTLPASDR